MLRLGLICDFLEERWTSMDLVGDVLFEQVARYYGEHIQTGRIRPAWRRRATALGILRLSRTAWNGDRLWNRMVEYPLRLRRERAGYDLFHIVDHSYAHLALSLPRGRTVITCHDLEAFRCLTEPAGEPRSLWFRAMAQRVLSGLRSAAHVVFVSHAVRREAVRLGLVSSECCSVIHNGAHPDAGMNEEAEREARQLLGANESALLLLSVGSTVSRKRIDVLLRVFAGVIEKHPAAILVRVGGPLTERQAHLARQLGITQSIVELPFLDRAVLTAVYRRATLLLQPSESEGFGLPIVEAMVCGCPVVASDLPVFREIGGEAAVYCRVGHVLAWTESVVNLLNQRRQKSPVWDRLQSRSIENAKRFSWRENADRMVRIYQHVAASS